MPTAEDRPAARVASRVAIVGRPNVGKSTLFNRLVGRRHALVDDQPGVTRDRIAAPCQATSIPCTLVDTGGIGAVLDDDFGAQIEVEADVAMQAADLILCVSAFTAQRVQRLHGVEPARVRVVHNALPSLPPRLPPAAVRSR